MTPARCGAVRCVRACVRAVNTSTTVKLLNSFDCHSGFLPSRGFGLRADRLSSPQFVIVLLFLFYLFFAVWATLFCLL